MATIIIGMTVRPNMDKVSDISELAAETKSIVSAFLKKEVTEKDIKIEVKPIAFGLKELNVAFMAPGDCESSQLEEMFEKSEIVESMMITRFELTLG